MAAPTGVPDVAESVKLRWPASGKVIAGFGGRPDGTHNDGINVSVPLGTEVHAAEDGVVAYAGSELKGYGNLVLLRHDNGWVTAYAHNDELLVKRGDKIKRGQVIAKAGKTGSVDQPQVHFELRQGSKPVDPVPYLEKL
jgi:murein DD-endopeptidase MepM/ murein hydrolase activator NlpD